MKKTLIKVKKTENWNKRNYYKTEDLMFMVQRAKDNKGWLVNISLNSIEPIGVVPSLLEAEKLIRRTRKTIKERLNG